MKRKLYEPIARHLKAGAWGRGREDSVWDLGAERIRLASKGYTFGDEKRIRFECKTYTFQARDVYVLVRCRIRLLRARSLVALV